MKANLLATPGVLWKASETLSLHEERYKRSPFMLPARDAAALFARRKRRLCGILCLRCVSNVVAWLPIAGSVTAEKSASLMRITLRCDVA